MFGGIEAGGTKIVLGIGTGPDEIAARTTVMTTDPDATIGAAVDWLRAHGPLDAVGIACFGPVELDRAAPRWGYITDTTKPGWSNTDVARRIGAALGCPVGFDTDVNGAALGEARWGAARGVASAVYLTIGTGIGGGIVIDGQPRHGLGHPEMGHGFPPLHPDDAGRVGHCPFHGACFEGLASGPAIKARWGASLSDLPPDHAAHMITAFYLGHLINTIRATIAPHRIVMGGGVMKTPGLLDRVRRSATDIAGHYFPVAAEAIVVAPGLGDDSGLLGAFALAMDAIGD